MADGKLKRFEASARGDFVGERRVIESQEQSRGRLSECSCSVLTGIVWEKGVVGGRAFAWCAGGRMALAGGGA